MKKADVKVGRWYVMRPPRIHRDRVLDGEKGWMVKVLGIGPFTYVVGECGRKEIKPTDQHSYIQLHVSGQRPVRWTGAVESFEEIIDFRDLLLTKKEWQEKHDALVHELARVQSAMDAHQAEIEKLRKRLVPALGPGVKVDPYNNGRVSITIDAALKILNPERGDVLRQILELQRKPRAEVTC